MSIYKRLSSYFSQFPWLHILILPLHLKHFIVLMLSQSVPISMNAYKINIL